MSTSSRKRPETLITVIKAVGEVAGHVADGLGGLKDALPLWAHWFIDVLLPLLEHADIVADAAAYAARRIGTAVWRRLARAARAAHRRWRGRYGRRGW
jgi:hypothetical protein